LEEEEVVDAKILLEEVEVELEELEEEDVAEEGFNRKNSISNLLLD
jgi:hypothetical protein